MKFDLEANGGQAPLKDVINFIQQVLDKDRAYARSVCTLLYPIENRGLFIQQIIAQKFLKTDKDISEVYDSINSTGKGQLSIYDLQEGLKKLKDFNLQDEEVQVFTDFINEKNQNSISKEEFEDKIQKLIDQQEPEEPWVCTKAAFMTAIADAYDKKKEADKNTIKEIFNHFDQDQDRALNQIEFINAVKFIEAQISESEIQKMYAEGVSLAKKQKISQSAFYFLLFKNAIGDFGVKIFGNFILINTEANKMLSEMDRDEEVKSQSSQKSSEKLKSPARSKDQTPLSSSNDNSYKLKITKVNKQDEEQTQQNKKKIPKLKNSASNKVEEDQADNSLKDHKLKRLPTNKHEENSNASNKKLLETPKRQSTSRKSIMKSPVKAQLLTSPKQ